MSEEPDDKIQISTTFGDRTYSFLVKRKEARFLREAGRIAERYIVQDRKINGFRNDIQDTLSHLAIIYITQFLEMKSNRDLPDLESELKDIVDNLENYNDHN